MITVLQRDPSKKGVRSVRFEKWNSKSTSLAWINCVNPTSSHYKLLSSTLRIAPHHLKSCIDPDKRPRVISSEHYAAFTVRATNGAHNRVKTPLVGFFILKNAVLTIHNKPITGLQKIKKLPVDQQLVLFGKNAHYLVYRLMDGLLGDFFEVIEHVEDEIDKIENQVLHEPSKLVTQKMFIQKRTLIYEHKALAVNRDIISSLEKNYTGTFTKSETVLFRDLYHDVVHLLDHVGTYRDILTSMLDIYLSSVSNNLNKVMKTLTLLSAFVMVPTLISGIYGMNFAFMPELFWRFGYPFSLGLMMLSVLVFYTYFKRKGWIGWP